MTALIRAAGMRGAAALLRERGVAIEPLMDGLGIPRAALVDEELRISLPAYGELLERASVAAACPDLGLQLAERQDISILGPLAIAMQHSATVGDALAVARRFLHAHSSGLRLGLHADAPRPGQTSLRLALVTPSWLPRRQLLELCLVDLHHFTVFLTPTPTRAPVLAVNLPHRPLARPERYAEAFGGPVRFAAAHAEVVVASEFLGWTLDGAQAALHRLSLDYLKLAFAGGEQPVREQVEDVLRRALASTRGRREIVARLLGLHPRTLQRRLESEGVTFSGLVDAARREQAHHWLTASGVPLAHVSDILGLAGAAVLCRSCRRWFGRSPAAVRSARGAGPGP